MIKEKVGAHSSAATTGFNHVLHQRGKIHAVQGDFADSLDADYDNSCCLCSLPFPLGGSARKKRKLLYNNPSEEARRFLNEILLKNLHLSLDSFEETRDSRGYLFHLCVSKAKTYYKLHDDLRKIEEEVVAKVSYLTSTVEGGQRRRPLNDPGERVRTASHAQTGNETWLLEKGRE